MSSEQLNVRMGLIVGDDPWDNLVHFASEYLRSLSLPESLSHLLLEPAFWGMSPLERTLYRHFKNKL